MPTLCITGKLECVVLRESLIMVEGVPEYQSSLEPWQSSDIVEVVLNSTEFVEY